VATLHADKNEFAVRSLDASLYETPILAQKYRRPSSSLTSVEQRQLAALNSIQQDYVREACIPTLVARQAALRPDALALVMGNVRLSYKELNWRANQLAHYLQALGVGHGVPVCLCIERSLDMVIGLLGILKAGGAYVPLDPAAPSERLSFMLTDTHAPVLITRQLLSARFTGHEAHVVCLDTGAAMLAQQSTVDPTSEVTASDLAYIVYTSGSTGQPKGVQITHDNLLNLIFWHQRTFGVTSSDHATQVASPAFDATGWELWPYLTAGASVHLPDEETRVTPTSLRDWLVAQGITITFLPTALAERVIALEWPSATALRFLLTGADTLHSYPPTDLPFALINNYGPTETTVVATSGLVLSLTDADPRERPSIGWPIANTEIYILDEQLQPVHAGEAGELYIGGAGVARGYHNRPELTAERFISHPFSNDPEARLYKTGDLVSALPDGQIAFVGRVDYQIKIRGYRIEPNEIVSALNQHPAIQESLVVAHEEAPGEKRLVAYIKLVPGAQVTTGALRENLATYLPEYMIPALYVQMPTLPTTANGKVDRTALPAPDATNTLRDEAIALPETPVEKQLEEIMAPLLGLERLGIDDNFFMLGGHSLLGTQIIMRVATTFGVNLTLLTLFESPTIRQLAAEVEQLVLARLEAMSDEEVERLLEQQKA
jgi:amino acid adenylation domain-containing protein